MTFLLTRALNVKQIEAEINSEQVKEDQRKRGEGGREEGERETDRQTDRQRQRQRKTERQIETEIRIRIRMVYSFRPLPLMKWCRWMTYHLTVHTIIIPMSKKTNRLTTMYMTN